MALLNDARKILSTDVRDLFRRPTPDNLRNKERVLANLRATKDRAERLARLMRYEEWMEFMDVIDENILSIDNTLKTVNARKFLSGEEEQKRSMLLERKECYERIRGMAQSANDSLQSLEDQVTEHQNDVTEYRERLGA